MSANPVIVERIEAQVKAAKAAVKRSPNDATAHAQLGIMYQQLDLNKHEGGTMQARARAYTRAKRARAILGSCSRVVCACVYVCGARSPWRCARTSARWSSA